MTSFKSRTPAVPLTVSRAVIIRRVLWIMAGFACPVFAGAQEVTYGATDSSAVLVETGEVRLYGAAWVQQGEIRLEAAYIVYSQETGQACAYAHLDSVGQSHGRPLLIQGDQQFEQDELCFDLQSHRGLSRRAVTHQAEAIFHAGLSKRQADERIHIRDGKFTTCDARDPHFHFHFKRAILIPGEKVVTGPLYLKIRKVPTPLGLPFGWFPTSPEKRSHGLLMPSYGDGNTLGFFLKDLGYYLPLGEYADLQLTTDLYTGGTWAARVASKYNWRYRFNGSLNLSYQRRRTGFTGLPTLTIENNFFVRWSHSQDARARPNSRFSANVNFGSQNNFQSNLNSTQLDYLSNTFQSSVQYSRTFPGKPISLAASARHSQNNTTGNVDVTMPALTINLNRTSVAGVMGLPAGRSRWLDDISLNGSTRFEQTISGTDTLIAAGRWDEMTWRNGIKHNLSASTALSAGFISITPSFQMNSFWAFSEVDGQVEVSEQGVYEAVYDTLSGFTSTSDWRLAANASTRFYGMFRLGENSRIPMIRHVISPSIGLSYTPENTRSEELLLGEDAVYWNPFSLSRFRPTDIRESGAVNLSISQNLEAKVRDKESGELRKVKLIDNFRTSTSYNMIADSLKLGAISTSAFTSLFNRVNLRMDVRHSAYDRDSTGATVDRFLAAEGKGLLRLTSASAAAGTRFSGGADSNWPWNAQVDYTLRVVPSWDAVLAEDVPQLTQGVSVRGDVRLWEKWRLNATTGYDFVQREFTPTRLEFYWDLHCWELSFNYIPNGIQQSYTIRLNVKASMLRDLKIEARGSNGQLIF